MRIGLDFSPQAHDQHVNRAVEHLGTFAVGEFKELLAAQYPTGTLRERQQQAIFTLSQWHDVTLRIN